MQLDKALKGALSACMRDHEFSGKAKQTLMLYCHDKVKARRVALVGLDSGTALNAATWVRLGAVCSRLATSVAAKHVVLALPDAAAADEDTVAILGLIARGAILGAYRYVTYKSQKGRLQTLKKLSVHVPIKADKAATARLRGACATGTVLGEAVCLARDLVNEPALDLYPETFAQRAVALAKEQGVACSVLDVAQLQKRNMNLLCAVGQGSAHPPCLVHLRYTPKRVGKAFDRGAIALVGKGITFDSGGLCLKPPDGMLTMKVDMAGAAAVLATVWAAAKLQLPVAIEGVLALAENMPSGKAYRPSDVFTSAAGKTVEVNNTDAEGRLVLADALHYTLALKPRCIVDLATLTGACMVALGNHTAGLFANDDPLASQLLTAAGRQGEDFWRLPLTPALRDQLKSDIADMRNTGDRYGGAITAALFLKEFVGDTAWAHLDIAGPATSNDDHGAHSKGGTGIAVATLIDFITASAGSPRAAQ